MNNDRTKVTACIMNFPQAFAFIAEHYPNKEDHHPKCSYRVAAMLCDCSCLWNEYNRRKVRVIDQEKEES